MKLTLTEATDFAGGKVLKQSLARRAGVLRDEHAQPGGKLAAASGGGVAHLVRSAWSSENTAVSRNCPA